MCPSHMATKNEVDSTRGRANMLRKVLTDGAAAGSDARAGLANEDLKPVSYTHLTLPTNREV